MAKLSPVKNLITAGSLNQGCYYVRALKKSWSVYHQSFKDGKKTDTRVEPLAYQELGFRPEWTLMEARQRCKVLNKEKTLIQAVARKAASRLTELQSIDEVLFPVDRVAAFSKKLEQENEGSDNHLKKMNSHFLKIQKLLKALELLPRNYKENEKLIYKCFAGQRVSLDYTQKLISLLNRWGQFTSKADGLFFEPIKPVKGISREKIREAQEDKLGVRRASKSLTPALLAAKKSKLSEPNYAFLFVSVWFGLRPSEVSKLGTPVIRANQDGTEFLVVYQSKLSGIQKSKRYKAIPIVCDEQRAAVKMLSEPIKAPIYQKMREVFGNGFGLYAGRKGFADLMLSKGYSIEDISLWLGHTSIETTWTHYKNKNALELPTPKLKSV
jgi:integrase